MIIFIVPFEVWHHMDTLLNGRSDEITRLTRRVPLVEQELLTLPEHLRSPHSIFSFMCMFCRSLFVHMYFFFWPLRCLLFEIRILCMFCRSLFILLSCFFWSLCCLFFFDFRILITPLVSSNSSYLNCRLN